MNVTEILTKMRADLDWRGPTGKKQGHIVLAWDDADLLYRTMMEHLFTSASLCTFGPPAERKQQWILKFEDHDVADMHFTDEGEAHRAFRTFSLSWTCTLFETAKEIP